MDPLAIAPARGQWHNEREGRERWRGGGESAEGKRTERVELVAPGMRPQQARCVSLPLNFFVAAQNVFRHR
eukprot:2489006-Prymnesium_polylepis.1